MMKKRKLKDQSLLDTSVEETEQTVDLVEDDENDAHVGVNNIQQHKRNKLKKRLKASDEIPLLEDAEEYAGCSSDNNLAPEVKMNGFKGPNLPVAECRET